MTHTAAILRDMVEHIRYEHDELFERADQLRHWSGDQNGTYRAVVESFAIHARNLIEFLWVNSRRNPATDVCADDYCPPGLWQTVTSGSKIVGPPGQIWKQASKQISHLTIERATAAPTDFNWDIEHVVGVIEPKFTDFLQAIDISWQPAFAARFPDLHPPAVARNPQQKSSGQLGPTNASTPTSGRHIPGTTARTH